MKRVLTAVVLIPLVLLVVFKAPDWLFALVVAIVAIVTLQEYLNVVKGYGIRPVIWLTYVAAVLAILGISAQSMQLALYWTVPSEWGIIFSPAILWMLPVLVGIPIVFRTDMRMALPAAAGSVFGVLYIPVALSLLVTLREGPGNEFLIVFVLVSVWVGDTAALYVGRSLGRHKLAPIVSPKKTWEGAIASVIASVAVAALVFRYREFINSVFSGHHEHSVFFSATFTWPSILVLGVLTNIAAQLGDLFESALKRGANLKDSGSLLPGHGGILDRIDALLFAIPVVWYYATFVGLTQQYKFYHPLR